MAAYVINLGAVRRAHRLLERADMQEFRRLATRLVISENQQGRSGYAVSDEIRCERQRHRLNPEGIA